MREERGQLPGGVVIDDEFTLWGSVGGNVTVVEGGKFYHRGSIYGDLTVEFGGRVHIFGNITGNLHVARGAKVIHSGVVCGNATNDGGRLFIEKESTIQGKVKTLRGDTIVDPKPHDPFGHQQQVYFPRKKRERERD